MRSESHEPEGRSSPPLLIANLNAEISALQLEQRRSQSDRAAAMLFQGALGLRFVLMLLTAGATLSRHSAPGTASIHVVRGRVTFRTEEEWRELVAGEVVLMERQRVHEVEATEESVLLITIALPRDSVES